MWVVSISPWNYAFHMTMANRMRQGQGQRMLRDNDMDKLSEVASQSTLA